MRSCWEAFNVGKIVGVAVSPESGFFLQASVVMGEIGVQMSDPDTPALDILNEILNSFGGSLFNEIRSKEVDPRPL